MTLAPARPTSTPSVTDGVDPSVTAVVITRRDPAGLAALLDAVLGQSLTPDAVVVLDRTAGAVLPAGADARDPEAADAAMADHDSTARPVAADHESTGRA